MDLFSDATETNILPYDGEAVYYGRIMPAAEAQQFRDRLLCDIAWKNDEVIMYGKHIVTKRKVAWYADNEFTYTYSNTPHHALVWTPDLLALKARVEQLTGFTYNSCLLNLYHNGEEGLGWHSDNEDALVRNGAIASLTFGAERKFSFRHKRTGDTVSIILEHGSLLLMKGVTQAHWKHKLHTSARITAPRINLTFRTMVPASALS